MPKGSPFGFFSALCDFFLKRFLMSQKGPPFEFFSYFATEYMLIKPKGSPFYIFRHYATVSERKKFKNFSKNSKKFFLKKSLLRFLSLRYSAGFRRSRLVYSYAELRLHSNTKRNMRLVVTFSFVLVRNPIVQDLSNKLSLVCSIIVLDIEQEKVIARCSAYFATIGCEN